ncbi:hypothetical protein ACN27G_05750 [Plantactinospora sp. WMMB334]|uniref:hypothetical protein n=1 Tax=Plantactinospora sp. WMMB334 TaxID=3404119 RepID=UPI003B926395
MTVWRLATRLGATLACATAGWAALPAAPAEAAPGFDTAITQLPGRFVAGRGAETVTAVVSTSLDGGCRKVRWSLVLRTEGLRLDQIGVDRVERTGTFPTEVRGEGGGARLTDRELDPGTLCRNRTVTAQYRLAVDEAATGGRVVLTVEAFDAEGRLLDRQGATREVVGGRDAAAPQGRAPAPTTPERTGSPSGGATASPTEPVEAEPTEPVDEDSPALAEGPDGAAGGPGDGGSGGGVATANADGGGIGLTELGFAAGALMLFLGAGLLLRLRLRSPLPESELAPARRRRRAAHYEW